MLHAQPCWHFFSHFIIWYYICCCSVIYHRLIFSKMEDWAKVLTNHDMVLTMLWNECHYFKCRSLPMSNYSLVHCHAYLYSLIHLPPPTSIFVKFVFQWGGVEKCLAQLVCEMQVCKSLSWLTNPCRWRQDGMEKGHRCSTWTMPTLFTVRFLVAYRLINY